VGSAEPRIPVVMADVPARPVRRACAHVAGFVLAALIGSAAWAEQAAGEQANLIYSPWFKSCDKDKGQPAAKETCLTIKDVRRATGQLLAGAALIEEGKSAARILRVTVPGPIRRGHSVVLGVDDDQPVVRRTRCPAEQCSVDFDVDRRLFTRLKTGRALNIRISGTSVGYTLPLANFTKPVSAAEAERLRPAMQPSLSQPIQCAGAYELCAWKRIPRGR
jgi:invasion protein IalB